ncbi:MAG TPA: hypothetical protein VNA19_10370 [Pyrinomonadaceae bacterium]|jgi:hypothetical protein|nr:hypothetical protein [Pyrinomonadaceae bacterium]
MPTKYSVDTALIEGERIARVWADNPSFGLGEVTLASLQEKLRSMREKRDRVESMRMQLAALTNELGAMATETANIVTRARSGFRAVFGPDSTQYEQAGGTRSSERRRSTPKKGAPATS